MLSLNQGPSHILDAIKLNHELFNTPCVGSSTNFAFTSHQLNLAHVREWDSGKRDIVLDVRTYLTWYSL